MMTQPAGRQMPLFVDVAAGDNVFVYVVRGLNLQWSVRRCVDGEEIFSREQRCEARSEAEARGYIFYERRPTCRTQ